MSNVDRTVARSSVAVLCGRGENAKTAINGEGQLTAD